MNSPYKPVDQTTTSLSADIEYNGKYKVLENWTTEKSSYCTFLVYNEVFKKKMIIKHPRPGQFKSFKDFVVAVGGWKRISDHPNIPTIHFIETLNTNRTIVMEYISSTTLERSSWTIMPRTRTQRQCAGIWKLRT